MTLIDNPDLGKAATSAPRGRRAEQVLASEQLFELRAMRAIMTKQAARTSGRMINDTLLTATYQFAVPGDGSTPVVALDFRVAAGSIRVTNLSATNPVTVYPGAPMGYAPAVGIGVAVVLQASSRVVVLGSHQCSIYGTAGDRVSVQVYTTPAEPNQ